MKFSTRSWSLSLFCGLLATSFLAPSGIEAQRPRPEAVGSMADLMSKVLYPASDSILYIETRTPENEAQWNQLVANAMLVAESANLLMMPTRAVDQGQWMRDTKLMLDAGKKAYKAAVERDVPALIALNEEMIQSCVVCHKRYREDYGKDYKKFPPPAP